ncbi:hypothetical protein SAMN02745975_02170 [Geosporobacter subterraneus DSM 17957]|uniref:UPF0178 protein SAMN02745975_02170 n=1 Tax=Geosporobacter subterraneus DSM 17957 TaxID=1121919 RepID=A0A1M6JKI5_9FIRM|nr:DUF188 domain-containing protein [Geosporobacter subterraneus]SHJ47175.1 hypothetical protein SAMN02745975_02170 [Geosporobacter subterraneus DSM 17957]
MFIYVDGDACPVKREIVEISSKYQLKVIIVLSICHLTKSDGFSEYVVVDHRNQSADMEIINRVKGGDIVITDDYGLASIVLMKRALCMSSRGMQYTADNMDLLLYKRHMNQKIMRAGGKVKGPSKRSSSENRLFVMNFENMLKKSLYNSQ